MLPVAQGIAGVPLFSGASVRLAVFVIAIVAAVGYFVFRLRHDKYEVLTSLPVEAAITRSQKFVLGVIALATVILVWAAPEFKWHNGELSASYIFLAIAIAVAGRLTARELLQNIAVEMDGLAVARSTLILNRLPGTLACVEAILRLAIEGVRTRTRRPCL
ncbi:putative ion transporter superfamily protein YfcC [Paraburkholderia tropica]|uniref:hypothetical protein n=1 Tax=Paraburkholderia TaxID=1822464 RepID=UPI000942A8CC|nr:hypothetical protein [Paraburkholderia tropica]MBB2983956.1 putative ion transporter superfamily protein YfcC [Paraburkholderia tropica]MBB3004815.1 putative ion transporter superfamily protein YfcC [Paraburkholderia tropica]MBB6323779.1 putative ion transporter superfamily protein YfcC [Paraburkholderia tropica]